MSIRLLISNDDGFIFVEGEIKRGNQRGEKSKINKLLNFFIESLIQG